MVKNNATQQQKSGNIAYWEKKYGRNYDGLRNGYKGVLFARATELIIGIALGLLLNKLIIAAITLL